MGKIINIDDLHRAAKHYDPVLKTLPFVQLEPVLANLGIRFLEVLDGDNIEVNFERNGSFLKPYSVGTSDKDADDKEAGRFTEMPLTPKKGLLRTQGPYRQLRDRKGAWKCWRTN